MRRLIFATVLGFAFPYLVFGGAVGSTCCEPGASACDPGLICNDDHECEDCPGVCLPNPLNSCTFSDLVDSVTNFIFVVSLALAPLMVVVGAFYLMTAAGNPNRVKTGNTIFLYTAIGLLVVLFARGLIAIIRSAVGAD